MNEFLFPKYDIETRKNEDGKYEIQLHSIIHIHLDFVFVFSVKIYEFSIENLYIVPSERDKKLAINQHLKECFTLSKYMIITDEILLQSTYIQTLYKTDPQFEHKLYTIYP